MRAMFVLDNGNGTVRVEYDFSWNTPANKPNQLAKFDLDVPGVPEVPSTIPAKYLAWNGAAFVEADAAVKAAVDAVEAAEAAVRYPEPDTTVPMVDASGVTVGTARIVANAVTLEPIIVVNSQSPKRSWQDQKGDIVSAVIERYAIVTELKNLKSGMVATIDAAQAIDPSSFSGTQKTQIQNLRGVAIDNAKAINNLRKVLQRYFKEPEL